MKKLFYITAAAVMAVAMLGSCMGDNVADEFKDWRESNTAWYNQQAASGQYTTLIAPWDPSAQVLVKWHNDRSLTAGNLSPLITSTVDVKYRGRLYDDTPFDSSYLNTTPADSIYRTAVNNNIEGWMIALTNMRVGDSCTVIVPYPQGYGSSNRSDLLKPFSMLVFDIKLVDIVGYRKN